MLSLFKYELFSRWGAILGWSLGLGFYGILIISLYPQFADKMSDISDIPFYKAMGIDFASLEGFLASQLIINIPLMFAIYVIMSSTDTLAGEEDRGTLELLVTMPLKRWQIATMKIFALTIVTLVIVSFAGMCSALMLISINDVVTGEVTPAQLFLVVLSGWPFTFAFLMMGLFFSACLPSRKIAAAFTTVIFVSSHVGELVASNVDSLDFIKPILLSHYLDSTATVFTEGVDPKDVAVLMGVGTILYVLTLISFQRRDITVGQWPWQRANPESHPRNF
jgi:ABC-2 type transport system permease protein